MVKEGRRDELRLLFRRALFLTTDGLKLEWRETGVFRGSHPPDLLNSARLLTAGMGGTISFGHISDPSTDVCSLDTARYKLWTRGVQDTWVLIDNCVPLKYPSIDTIRQLGQFLSLSISGDSCFWKSFIHGERATTDTEASLSHLDHHDPSFIFFFLQRLTRTLT